MKKRTVEKILGYTTAFLCIIITILSQFFDVLIKGKELSFLIIFAGIASLFLVHIYFEIKKLNDPTHNKHTTWDGINCPYGSGGVRLVTDTNKYKEIFDGFEGYYHAFNAPLRFETYDLKHQGDIHAKRYRSENFIRAYYYYPVLREVNEQERNIWITNIYALYKRLENKLSQKERNKIIFYVPLETSKQTGTSNQLVTYFYGEKDGTEQCITYIHTQAFITDTHPNFMMIFFDSNVLKYIKNHIESSRKSLTPIKGIPKFVKYLEKNYKEACDRAEITFDL